jgi:amino-acid N-acetyltransferase
MQVSDLRGILNYIPRFRDKIFVLSLDGGIIAHDNFSNILLDLAVLRSLNIRIVLVHGAARQIRELAKQTKTKISNDDGTGITDEETLNIAMTAASRVTHEIMEGLASSDLRACYGNVITAHPYGIIGGVDHLFTGRVERVDCVFIEQLLERGILPVIPPLGFDGEGRTFRVNSDSVAQKVAEELKATKLIYVTDMPGLSKGGDIVNQMPVKEAEDYFKKNRDEIPLGLVSKLEHSIKACREGVSRVHLIDGRIDEALLTEIFSNEGIGTMIYANEYQQIRRALKKDARPIFSLIQHSVESEELMTRPLRDILTQIQDYYVFEVDRNIIGCVALHTYPETKTAELACLYVNKAHENQGIGAKLMLFVETMAREKGCKTLCALSTHAFNYLQQKGGYKEGDTNILPSSRLEKYEQSGRKSKVLYKSLS